MSQLFCSPAFKRQVRISFTFHQKGTESPSARSPTRAAMAPSESQSPGRSIVLKIREGCETGPVLDEFVLSDCNNLYAFVAFYQPPELRRATSLDLRKTELFDGDPLYPGQHDAASVNFPPVCASQTVEYNEAYLSLFHALRAHYEHAYDFSILFNRIFNHLEF